jgi:hypothetical protein
VISGLDHLEGCAVAVLADGEPVNGLRVAGGAISLPAPASHVHVGLPFVGELETLALELESQDGTTQGRKKKVARVTLRVMNTRGLEAGPTETELTPLSYRDEGLATGDFDVVVAPHWNTDGRVFVRQTAPLPATVLAIIPEVVPGDR